MVASSAARATHMSDGLVAMQCSLVPRTASVRLLPVMAEQPVVGQNIGRCAGRGSPVKRACVAMSLLLALLGTLRAALKGRTDLVLENLALRQQLALLRRRSKRPRVGLLDRVFWIWLSQWWTVAGSAPCRSAADRDSLAPAGVSPALGMGIAARAN